MSKPEIHYFPLRGRAEVKHMLSCLMAKLNAPACHHGPDQPCLPAFAMMAALVSCKTPPECW